jgi:predicted naringenin-chalcone synthase
MLATLSDFQHIRPHHEIDQEHILDWIAQTHARAAHPATNEERDAFCTQIREKIARLGVGSERIQNRGIHIHDLFGGEEIYSIDENADGHGFTERSHFFDREVSKIFERFYPEEARLPAHLIHVTCTGYVAPSPAQKIVSKRQCGTSTTVTHAYHMGCYGAISAIRMGAGFSSLPSPSPFIDIVHTEVCSIHMHPRRHGSEQLLVQSLFGDGFIKYTLQSKAPAGPHLKILALHEETIPDSAHCMTWRCETQGMGMTLSKEVPVLIARSIEGYLQRLGAKTKDAFFAIHPGGPKILQHAKDLLKLDASQLEHSEWVLKHYGNMSSATLPHIWERMLADPQVPIGAQIISLAFGPGLTIIGGIFEKGLK